MLFEQVDGALHHTLRSSNPIGKLNGPVAHYSDRPHGSTVIETAPLDGHIHLGLTDAQKRTLQRSEDSRGGHYSSYRILTLPFKAPDAPVNPWPVTLYESGSPIDA